MKLTNIFALLVAGAAALEAETTVDAETTEDTMTDRLTALAESDYAPSLIPEAGTPEPCSGFEYSGPLVGPLTIRNDGTVIENKIINAQL